MARQMERMLGRRDQAGFRQSIMPKLALWMKAAEQAPNKEPSQSQDR
jgi:hypothetical protein